MNISIPATETTAPPVIVADAGRAGRILVVDDVEDNREILTRRLTRRGFEVREACNGTEALDMVEREPFDLVLMDIMMPDINGTEVVRRLRQTRSQADLPIIMVSAKTLSEDVAESLELGANDYIIKPVDFTVALARIRAQLDRKRLSDEVAMQAKSEKRLLEQASSVLAEDNRKSQERLEYLAYHDELTGLNNRVAFRSAVERTLDDEAMRARQLVLLFIDLDRFKSINDVYGHQVGDKLLQQVGIRLRQHLGDAIAVARLGGDEFAALVAEDDAPGSATELADVIVEAMSEPFDGEGRQKLHIGATVGTAGAALCDFKAETLMKAADLAMYRAKGTGRGRVVSFEPKLLEEQRERSELEVDLREAVKLEQFEVFYQPLVNAKTNELSCFEALVRWNHPQRGVVSPALFIPTAEESGLINQLGSWVLRRACHDAMAWPEHVRVAVNLSPRQFGHPGLIDLIAKTLKDSGLAPQRLEVELTESCLLEAGENNVRILQQIRELGVRVAIDDFGTGYSSMSYLQNFTFDKLKIDRRFVEDLENNQKTAAIINAIVQLGSSIGICTAAEGIETEAQFDAVVRHGCSEVQGYLLGRPQPLTETMMNLSRSRRD